MTDPIDQVRATYDSDPKGEWGRFETHAQMRLEYLITPCDRPDIVGVSSLLLAVVRNMRDHDHPV
jgi:hypothetical protein